MWAVFKAYSWSSITLSAYNGTLALSTPAEGPQRFIPLFDTKEQALAFTNGDDTNIFQVELRRDS